MKFWPLTVHLELQFDALSVEPNPWWIPFWWIRHPWEKPRHPNADPMNGFILRCGIFGFHFCAAIHFYGGAHADVIVKSADGEPFACTWPDCGRDTNCVTGDVCRPQCRGKTIP